MSNWNSKPVNAPAGTKHIHNGVTYVARKDAGNTVWDVDSTGASAGGSPGSKVRNFSRFYCGDGQMDGHLYGIVLIDQADNVRVGMGNNKYYARGWNNTYQMMNTLPLPAAETPKSVTATYENTLVLTNNGNVFASGRNDLRQLALADNSQDTNNPKLRSVKGTPSRVRKIIAGGAVNTTIFYLLEDNRLFASGHNPNGFAFGRGDNKNTSKSSTVTPMYNVSQNINNGNSQIQDFMWCGYHGGGIGYNYNQTAVALTTDGHIYTSGENGHGTRGDGTTGNGSADKYQRYNRVVQGGANLYKFVKIKAAAGASAHSVYALTDNGDLLGWGYNAHGQLANGTTTSTGTPYLMASGVEDFWCGGGSHGMVFIRKADGLHACGYNGYGQLGDGTTTTQKSFKKITLSGTVDKVFTCGYHSPLSTYVRTTDGRLFASGYNAYGQLGLGDFTNRNRFEQLDLPCYPSQVRSMTDMYGNGQGNLLVADPAGDLHACGTAAHHLFNEGGGRHVALLTRVNVL